MRSVAQSELSRNPGGVSGPRNEAISMHREIGMPKHVEMAETMLGEVR